MQVNARAAGLASPLVSWLSGLAAEARFRRRWLGRAPVILPPRDRAWRALAPPFPEWLDLARSGLPFQIAADRRYDRSGDPRRLRPALARGETVFFPQIHQVLPRVARLMAALRATFLGAGREECSFLFMAEGRGREGLGLHHDGAVDAFWLQLEGRRALTIGPPVPRGVPEDLPDAYARRRPSGWRELELGPGTLFYLPPRTPHRVVYHERSLALSLTWKVARRRAMAVDARPAGLAEWDVTSGRADRIPPRRRDRLWTQVPAIPGAVTRKTRQFPLRLPGGVTVLLPARAYPLAAHLAAMPSWRLPLGRARRAGLAALIERGVVAPRDLPLRIIPEAPRDLDGWRFG
jgi:mannose-6-phosphate isomerase-like protein (cupin superfamily)